MKTPRLDEELLAPVELDTVQRMVKACPMNIFTGLRDQALLWFLLDTGCRANEAILLDLADVNPATDAALIRHSKSRKPSKGYPSVPYPLHKQK